MITIYADTFSTEAEHVAVTRGEGWQADHVLILYQRPDERLPVAGDGSSWIPPADQPVRGRPVVKWTIEPAGASYAIPDFGGGVGIRLAVLAAVDALRRPRISGWVMVAEGLPIVHDGRPLVIFVAVDEKGLPVAAAGGYTPNVDAPSHAPSHAPSE